MILIILLEPVQHNIVVSIPCTNVYDVHKLAKNSLLKDPRLSGLSDGIEVVCSTLQVYKVRFYRGLLNDYLIEWHNKAVRPGDTCKKVYLTYRGAILF